MTSKSRPQVIEMIPISRIHVLNPRSRNKKQHREIVDNIGAIGLKRPVTVIRRGSKEGAGYDLVCGEGRLEAFRMLGATEIPAVIVEATEAEGLVMSLVENIARRQHRPIDIMQEIGALHSRGYSDGEVAEKIGCTASWVNMIVTLLERGEERLVAAVESGLIPISFAIEIARAETSEAQQILMEAYAAGKLKGKKLTAVRKLIDQRMRHQKAIFDGGLGRKNTPKHLTSAELMRIYQRESDKQRLLVVKSNFVQSRLLFMIEALKDLLNDEGYRTLLRAEGLESLPRILSARIAGEAVQ